MDRAIPKCLVGRGHNKNTERTQEMQVDRANNMMYNDVLRNVGNV